MKNLPTKSAPTKIAKTEAVREHATKKLCDRYGIGNPSAGQNGFSFFSLIPDGKDRISSANLLQPCLEKKWEPIPNRSK